MITNWQKINNIIHIWKNHHKKKGKNFKRKKKKGKKRKWRLWLRRLVVGVRLFGFNHSRSTDEGVTIMTPFIIITFITLSAHHPHIWWPIIMIIINMHNAMWHLLLLFHPLPFLSHETRIMWFSLFAYVMWLNLWAYM